MSDIAVLGGGHGAYAAAADLAEQGHDVRLWRRDSDAFATVRDNKQITLTDANGSRAVDLALASDDLGEVVSGAELIVIPGPAFAQSDIARAMAPHVQAGQMIFLPPGSFGSYTMAAEIREISQVEDLALAETGTLPYLAAQTRPGGNRDLGARDALADRRVSGAACRSSFADHCRGLSRGRAHRGRAERRADECRPDHPHAVDYDERGAARTFRPLGHSQ